MGKKRALFNFYDKLFLVVLNRTGLHHHYFRQAVCRMDILLTIVVTETLKLPFFVGAPGFEPGTSWSRTKRASRAALRPEHVPLLLNYGKSVPKARVLTVCQEEVWLFSVFRIVSSRSLPASCTHGRHTTVESRFSSTCRLPSTVDKSQPRMSLQRSEP